MIGVLLGRIWAAIVANPARTIAGLIAVFPAVVAFLNTFGLVVSQDGSTATINLLNTLLVLVGGEVIRSKVSPADYTDADERDDPAELDSAG